MAYLKKGKSESKYFSIIVIVFIILFMIVVGRVFIIQNIEHDKWIAISDSLRKVGAEREIPPMRGNIYSDNKELLASTVPVYTLYMDFGDQALRKDNGILFRSNVDSLSLRLASKLKDKTTKEYCALLWKGYNSKSRRYKISDLKLSHADFKEVLRFPLFRLGRVKSGLTPYKQIRRIKPYGSLAAITIGDVYGDEQKGAKYGIEAAFNKFLQGIPGHGHCDKKAGANILITDEQPINGANIESTINVDIQDIVEKALRQRLKDIDADEGSVIVMEVKTGQIKACANLEKRSDSTYREVRSIAFTSDLEPGSTFKIPAIMAALDEGRVKITDSVNCEHGIWKFNDKVTISDANTGESGNGVIPVPQVIVRSSNVGMGKLIYYAYKNNPQAYVDKLHEMGVGYPIDFGFKGMAHASILGPRERRLLKKPWAISDLASMAFGYSVDMPLIYTLTFYNAIANGGKMMQPYLVKRISRDDRILKEFQPVVLKEKICKDSTLDKVKNMMLQVVEDPLHATGKPARSRYVRIAGKTGTARYGYGKADVKGHQKYRHQVFFCGFFPYDDPQYSCIVYMRNPKKGVASGGNMAGRTFKEIAERIMAKISNINVDRYVSDSARTMFPKIKVSDRQQLEKLFKILNIDYQKPDFNTPWINIKMDSTGKKPIMIPYESKANRVPNFSGFGLEDAIYLSEKIGLNPYAKGRGKVYKQNLVPYSKFQRGDVIRFELK